MLAPLKGGIEAQHRAEKFKLKPLPDFTALPENEDPAYPLILISAKSRYYLLSSYRWVEKLRQKRPHPIVEIHPETAASRGISDGDPVVIETRYGNITQVARVTDIVHPRVVSAARLGWWFPEGGAARQFEWQTPISICSLPSASWGKNSGRRT